ncbi:hypothetical protein C770_GR4pC1337 (plasmid) [Sinorhizobium meliloti GR4]|nr:hypothetical protein C770_GR4pC1337 [Sinorhizobium meliloti GR4]
MKAFLGIKPVILEIDTCQLMRFREISAGFREDDHGREHSHA